MENFERLFDKQSQELGTKVRMELDPRVERLIKDSIALQDRIIRLYC